MRDLEGYFKGLADMTRLRILNLLLQGELCVCDLQRLVEGSQPTVSRHLSYLKHSGLALDRRDGLRVFYRLAKGNNPDLQALHQFLRKVFKGKGILEEDLKELRDAQTRGRCALPTPLHSAKPERSEASGSRTRLAAR